MLDARLSVCATASTARLVVGAGLIARTAMLRVFLEIHAILTGTTYLLTVGTNTDALLTAFLSLADVSATTAMLCVVIQGDTGLSTARFAVLTSVVATTFIDSSIAIVIDRSVAIFALWTRKHHTSARSPLLVEAELDTRLTTTYILD